MGFIIEVFGCWSCIYEIYESVINCICIEFLYVDDIIMLGGYFFYSYQNGINMYFVYDYNVVDCKLEEEIDKYYNLFNKIICEEIICFGGLMVYYYGIGKYCVYWSKLEYGSVWVLLEGLKKQFDFNGIMNMGIIYLIEK